MMELTDIPHTRFHPHFVVLLSGCFWLIFIMQVDFRPDKHVVYNVDFMEFTNDKKGSHYRFHKIKKNRLTLRLETLRILLGLERHQATVTLKQLKRLRFCPFYHLCSIIYQCLSINKQVIIGEWLG